MVAYLKISKSTPNSFLVISGINTRSPEALFLMKAIQSLWETNVERFFSRHKLYYTTNSKSKPHVHIKEAFYCEIRRGNIVGVLDVVDAPHIKILMYGAPPGHKAFVPSLGARSEYGTWGGITTLYWNTWQSFFQREVYALLGTYNFDVQGKRKLKRKHVDIDAIRAREIKKIRTTVRGMRIGNI